MTEPARRTKRRYAHELYPHPGDYEIRPLSVEVPHLYAMAVGLDVWGTSWCDIEPRSLAMDRMGHMVNAAHIALLADALAQGMTGDEAWAWASERTGDDAEWAYERAAHYGVPVDLIKPYACGPEPDHHDHLGLTDAHGWRTATRIDCPESECPDCTEPIEPEAVADEGRAGA